MTEVERVKTVVKWLIFIGIGGNEKEIAQILGYNKDYFSQIKNNHALLNDKFRKTLCKADKNLNLTWITKGEGPMLKSLSSIEKFQLVEVSSDEVMNLKFELLDVHRQLRDCQNQLFGFKKTASE